MTAEARAIVRNGIETDWETFQTDHGPGFIFLELPVTPSVHDGGSLAGNESSRTRSISTSLIT